MSRPILRSLLGAVAASLLIAAAGACTRDNPRNSRLPLRMADSRRPAAPATTRRPRRARPTRQTTGRRYRRTARSPAAPCNVDSDCTRRARAAPSALRRAVRRREPVPGGPDLHRRALLQRRRADLRHVGAWSLCTADTAVRQRPRCASAASATRPARPRATARSARLQQRRLRRRRADDRRSACGTTTAARRSAASTPTATRCARPTRSAGRRRSATRACAAPTTAPRLTDGHRSPAWQRRRNSRRRFAPRRR